MLPFDQENIVAIATPPGVGALAIVRLSGPNLKPLYKKFTRQQPKHRFALFTKLYHPINNLILDEVVATFFRSPSSYTGEDIIEISCHGGLAVKKSILQAALDGGARLANPGEFSYRSFLNGKMDLLQVEAVSALVSSRTSHSAGISLNLLDGKVSALLREIKSQVIDVLSIIENELNFLEDEISFISYSSIRSKIKKVRSQIDDIINSSVIGKKIFAGIRVIILGRPNTGKSSLFNALIGENRAITSPVAGTTRDTVEVSFELEGVPVCLIDTAGIWEAGDHLDSLGVEKTKSEIGRADLCIIVDDEDPRHIFNKRFINIKQQDYIFVKSKSDLTKCPPSVDENIINVSSKENIGIDVLLTSLSTYIINNINISDKESAFLVSQRQIGLLKDSLFCLDEAIIQVESGVETDIIASTLNGFVFSIKDIVGEIPNKDVLQNIFNNFCVGK